VISPEEITVDTNKVRDHLDWKLAKSLHQVRSFQGLVGYYRRFIPNFSKILKPISKFLKKGNKYVWSKDCDDAFKTLKKLLTTLYVLAYPDIAKLFIFIAMLLVLVWDVS
jgi:hypothetical protein